MAAGMAKKYTAILREDFFISVPLGRRIEGSSDLVEGLTMKSGISMRPSTPKECKMIYTESARSAEGIRPVTDFQCVA
ncbi:hypothetical protein [Streptomyces sp. DT171]|uniref:hypothetical protein n=1 Tax=Streptomyces sp. DT171 TaxID=3416524 RepID=UPI003CF54303